MSDQSDIKRPNRKRKKTFLKNARKYGKKGRFGRGSQLDVDTYQYFVGILETYNKGFDNEEEKLVFVNNVFKQIENEEVNYSKNQVGCRVIETILPLASDVVLKKFFEAFSSELRPLCSDCFASHVIEVLITQSAKRSLNPDISSDARNDYQQFLIKISKFLLNNLEDYIWDTYGNHIIRSCLENCKENSYIIKEYAERLISWPQFNEFCTSELVSALLQVLLRCLKDIDLNLLKIYLKRLLKDVFLINTTECQTIWPNAFCSKAVLMLLETALQVGSPKMFSKIYKKLFCGRLAKLAVTRNTNFAVQKLLEYCTKKEEFESMFDELVDCFKEILENGHSGILLAIARACKKLHTRQGSFVQNLMKILNCYEPEERQNHFVLSLCQFKPFEDKPLVNINLQKDKLNLHGTLIVQILLDFDKPIKLVNGVLSMDSTDLKNLFSNTMGSHIVDAYVKGSFVGEKNREKLVRKMRGNYQELASSKYGSRSFEAIWNIASLKFKILIMEELSEKHAAWSNSDYGKIICGKINLSLFKRNKEDWKRSLNNVNKVENILATILE